MKRTLLAIVAIITGLSMSLVACSNKKSMNTENSNEALLEYLETAQTGGVEDKVPDPDAPQLEVISIYAPNEDGTKLNKELDAISELNATLLFDKLKEYNIVPNESSVVDFTIDGKTAELQISGVNLSNELITEAIINTFMENFELDSVSIRSID